MMIFKLFGLIRALFKGESLLNPETWKNIQLSTESLVVIAVAVLAFFPDLNVSEAQILGVCSAVALIVSTILTVATTKKIGLPAEGKAYEYIKSKVPEAINHDDVVVTDDGVQFRSSSRETELPLSDKTKPNSVNSGGKGLLGR